MLFIKTSSSPPPAPPAQHHFESRTITTSSTTKSSMACVQEYAAADLRTTVHHTSEFDQIWTFDNHGFETSDTNEYIHYTDIHHHGNGNIPDMPELDPQDLSQLDPIMPTSSENGIMSPDSQMHVTSTALSPYTEYTQQMSPTSLSFPGPTVPSSAAYVGEFGFEVSVEKQMKETKSTQWTYSKSLNKLYVRPHVPCPFIIKTTKTPPPGSYIRAMPVYMKPEHVQDVVRRCPNHSVVKHPDETPVSVCHLLRTTDQMARYVEDPYMCRLSVILPHEEPQAGAEWVTALFQFMCFSSCVGGLNRRNVQVIFTLEHDNVVLGRRAIEVRICACPGRDLSADEKIKCDRKPLLKRRPGKKLEEQGSRMEQPAFVTESFYPDRKRTAADDDGDVYKLEVRGRHNYELLCQLRDSLEIASLLSPQQADQLKTQMKNMHQRLPVEDRVLDMKAPLQVAQPGPGKIQRKSVPSTASYVLNPQSLVSPSTLPQYQLSSAPQNGYYYTN